MKNTAQIIDHYTGALNADSYKVQLKNRITNCGFGMQYTPEQLVRSIGFLRKQNADGYDVYCRPVGYQFVLLDDLTRQVLNDVAEIQPCILMETSPNNYQAWLILEEVPQNRELAKNICRELAQRFNADMASADPDHVGRLPGFTNKKDKYRSSNGLYPFVRLCRAANRFSSFYPGGGAVPSSVQLEKQESKSAKKSNNGISEQDFGKACWLIRQGKSDDAICQYLLQNSPDIIQRKGSRGVQKYLELTIYNARRVVEKGGN